MGFTPYPYKNTRSGWPRGCVFLTAIFLVVAITTCVLSGTAIGRGFVPPLEIRQRLGPLQLVGTTTLTPDCALAFPCGAPLLLRNPSLIRFYVVWVVVTLPGPNGAQVNSYRLMMTPLEP